MDHKKKHITLSQKKGLLAGETQVPDTWKQQQMDACYSKLFRHKHFLYFPGTILLFDLI